VSNQFLVQILLLIFAAVTVSTIANTTTAIAKPNSKVLAAAKACEPSARSLLQHLVQIDSRTGDVTGLAAMGGILKTELEGLGASVEIVHAVAPAVGDNLVATLTGAIWSSKRLGLSITRRGSQMAKSALVASAWKWKGA
jgi:hypothetical protein